MRASLYWIMAGAFALALFLTGRMRRVALARGIVDHPNVRSSHGVATPRGGGLAVVVASMAGFGTLAGLGGISADLFMALSVGGLAVALVGFLDDLRQVPVSIRLIVHFCAAMWALAWLGGLPSLQVDDHFVQLGGWGFALGTVAIVWAINLFNFMDGIDGLAAAEAVFIAWGGALLALLTVVTSTVFGAALVFGAACGGFLIWNWPPAKIFMGDAGSGYLGYSAAVLAISSGHEKSVSLFVWLILGGVFFVDATLTLLRRLIRRARIHEAHRDHAYQRLARRWKSHRRVTMAVALVNLLWLLPCATLAMLNPEAAGAISLIALAPIVAIAAALGAGQTEAKRLE